MAEPEMKTLYFHACGCAWEGDVQTAECEMHTRLRVEGGPVERARNAALQAACGWAFDMGRQVESDLDDLRAGLRCVSEKWAPLSVRSKHSELADALAEHAAGYLTNWRARGQ